MNLLYGRPTSRRERLPTSRRERGGVEEEKQPAKKVKLNEECWKDASAEEEANIDIHADRQQARVTCGANR